MCSIRSTPNVNTIYIILDWTKDMWIFLENSTLNFNLWSLSILKYISQNFYNILNMLIWVDSRYTDRDILTIPRVFKDNTITIVNLNVTTFSLVNDGWMEQWFNWSRKIRDSSIFIEQYVFSFVQVQKMIIEPWQNVFCVQMDCFLFEVIVLSNFQRLTNMRRRV